MHPLTPPPGYGPGTYMYTMYNTKGHVTQCTASSAHYQSLTGFTGSHMPMSSEGSDPSQLLLLAYGMLGLWLLDLLRQLYTYTLFCISLSLFSGLHSTQRRGNNTTVFYQGINLVLGLLQ